MSEVISCVNFIKSLPSGYDTCANSNVDLNSINKLWDNVVDKIAANLGSNKEYTSLNLYQQAAFRLMLKHYLQDDLYSGGKVSDVVDRNQAFCSHKTLGHVGRIRAWLVRSLSWADNSTRYPNTCGPRELTTDKVKALLAGAAKIEAKLTLTSGSPTTLSPGVANPSFSIKVSPASFLTTISKHLQNYSQSSRQNVTVPLPNLSVATTALALICSKDVSFTINNLQSAADGSFIITATPVIPSGAVLSQASELVVGYKTTKPADQLARASADKIFTFAATSELGSDTAGRSKTTEGTAGTGAATGAGAPARKLTTLNAPTGELKAGEKVFLEFKGQNIFCDDTKITATSSDPTKVALAPARVIGARFNGGPDCNKVSVEATTAKEATGTVTITVKTNGQTFPFTKTISGTTPPPADSTAPAYTRISQKAVRPGQAYTLIISGKNIPESATVEVADGQATIPTDSISSSDTRIRFKLNVFGSAKEPIKIHVKEGDKTVKTYTVKVETETPPPPPPPPASAAKGICDDARKPEKCKRFCEPLDTKQKAITGNDAESLESKAMIKVELNKCLTKYGKK